MMRRGTKTCKGPVVGRPGQTQWNQRRLRCPVGQSLGPVHRVTEGPTGLAVGWLTTRWQVYTKKAQGWMQVSLQQVTETGGEQRCSRKEWAGRRW